MGQASAVVKEHVQCLAAVANPFPCACSVSARGEGEFAGDYMKQFADLTPRTRRGARSDHSLVLEGHHKTNLHCCVSIAKTFGCHDSGLVNPSLNRPFKTNLVALMDVDEDGMEWGEICNAVFMTRAVGAESTDHNDEFENLRHGRVGGRGAMQVQEGPSYIDVHNKLSDEEVAAFEPIVGLKVPSNFRECGYDWRADRGSSTASEEQQELIREIVKPFIRDMMGGVLVKLQLDDAGDGASEGSASSRSCDSADLSTALGRYLDVKVYFSENLEVLLVVAKKSGIERSVPLRGVRWVRPIGEEGVGVPDRELCVKMRLAGGRYLTYKFDTEEQVAYFGACMRILVKAARSEREVSHATVTLKPQKLQEA